MSNTNPEEQLKKSLIEVDILRFEVKKLEKEVAEKKEALHQLRHSTSWRITKPLRAVKKVLVAFGKAIKLLPKIPVLITHIRKFGWQKALRNAKSRLNLTPSINLYKLVHLSESELSQQKGTLFPFMPLISIVVPLYNTQQAYLCELMDSAFAQTYSNWQLILVDASDKTPNEVQSICLAHTAEDSRVLYKKLERNQGISQNTNHGLDLATGDFLTLLDHDDLLHPAALFEVVKSINETDADLLYTDEINYSGSLEYNSSPHFKPDFSPDTLRSYNYICHLMVYSRELHEKCGNLQKEYDGSQDYDLVLRLSEQAKKIVHIPQPLYFWRQHEGSFSYDVVQKEQCIVSAKKALSNHLERIGLKGQVLDAQQLTCYRIKYELAGTPLISIIIPNKDHVGDLDKCLSSILEKTSYPNYEILIIENNSEDPKTFKYYESLNDKSIRVIQYPGTFNYAAINNHAAKCSTCDYLVLLNNDTEVITPEWLEEMLMFAQRDDVGAVGAKLYYADDTIQHAGVILGIGGTAGHSHKGCNRSDNGYSNRLQLVQNISAVTGACLMVSREKFFEVDGFDENFTVALNDVDLCLKLREHSYLNIFTPFAELYHYESKSRGYEDSREKKRRFRDEIFLFHSKWGELLRTGDPYYNPNLTLDEENFTMA